MSSDLRPPVRKYDFTAHSTTRPQEPQPGDRLDSEFNELAKVSKATVEAIKAITTPEGKLGQVVGLDQLLPDVVEKFGQEVKAAIEVDTADAKHAATEAHKSTSAARRYKADAEEAATLAQSSANQILSATDGVIATAQALALHVDEATAKLGQEITTFNNDANHIAGDVEESRLLTQLAQAWAEHMPDIIPPYLLEVMGITGDHWSSRWWANYTDQKIAIWEDEYDQAIISIDNFNDLYLGAKDFPPTLDNDGDPLQEGAMYWSIPEDVMYVWTGTYWVSMTGEGEVNMAENVGSGHGIYANKAGPVLQFKSLVLSANFTVVDTATEIQITIANLAWVKITGTPTTLVGYGITDAYTKTQVDSLQVAQDQALHTYVDTQNAAQDAASSSALALKVDKTSNTGAALIPAGDTSLRPNSAVPGSLRYNSTLKRFEGYDGAAWKATAAPTVIGATPPASAQPGEFWWSNSLGTLFIYYFDGNSYQWVSTNPAMDPGDIYTKADANAQFVNVTGDTMTGDLHAPNIYDKAASDARFVNVTGDSMSGQLNVPSISIDPNYNIYMGGANPVLGFDNNDYFVYDRAGNTLVWAVGGTGKFWIDGNGTATFAGAVYTPQVVFDPTFSIQRNTTFPYINFDAGDHLGYDRNGNTFNFTIGNTHMGRVDGSGNWIAAGAVYAGGSAFISSGNDAILSNNGQGAIFFRPCGPWDGTNQAYLEHGGRMVAPQFWSSGSIYFSQNLQSTSVNACLGAQGGAVFLRPHGENNGTNEAILDADGWLTARKFKTKPGDAGGYGTKEGWGGGATANNMFNFWWNGSGYLFGYVDNTYVGYLTPASDYRIKKDVAPLPSMWETAKKLRPVQYTHKEYWAAPYTDPEGVTHEAASPLIVGDEVERWGFLAHELQEALTPSASTGVKDAPNALQTPNPWTVIATLTKTLQEAQTRIETLEARLTALEAT